MDEEMEVETIYDVHEVDLSYEFDAPLFFDLSRPETLPELRIAQEWFLDAPSYPPSPFVAKLLWAEQNSWLHENVGVSNQTAYFDSGMETINENDCEEITERIMSNFHGCSTVVPSQQCGVTTSALPLLNSLSQSTKNTTRSNIKQKFCRSSTLMKPTASILAKQNRIQARPVNILTHGDDTLSHTAGVEIQASKRQKLEAGHLFKVNEARQQAEFLHKTPKKNADTDKNSVSTKMKLTIPREPVLATTSRVQKKRNELGSRPASVAEHGFKARPLNRKILEAPSFPIPKRSTPKLPEFQEFHLKTSERAMQHSSVSSSSLSNHSTHKELAKPCNLYATEIGRRDCRRPSALINTKLDKCENNFSFKSRSSTKKTVLSKGETSDVKDEKHDVSVPVKEKSLQHNPPIELFNKLTLTSEAQELDRSRIQCPRPSIMSGSKENRFYSFQTDHKMTVPGEATVGVKKIAPASDVMRNYQTVRSR